MAAIAACKLETTSFLKSSLSANACSFTPSFCSLTVTPGTNEHNLEIGQTDDLGTESEHSKGVDRSHLNKIKKRGLTLRLSV